MLALTRRVGEEVVIGDPASPQGVIRIVSIQGDKVRLSFDFPHDIQINRKELAEMKRRQAEREADEAGKPSNGQTASQNDNGTSDDQKKAG